MPPETSSPQALDYEDIIDLLPDEVPGDGPNRRKHNLTRSDLVLIGRMIEAKGGHQTCSQFTQEEIVVGKKVLRILNKTASVIGMAIIVAVIGAIIALFSKGFWKQLSDMVVK